MNILDGSGDPVTIKGIVSEKVVAEKGIKEVKEILQNIFGKKVTTIWAGNDLAYLVDVPFSKGFLMDFDTGDLETNAFLWQTQVQHIVAWACGEYKWEKISPYSAKRRVAVCR